MTSRERRQELKSLARLYAVEFPTSLSIMELEELRDLIHGHRPLPDGNWNLVENPAKQAQKNKPRILRLLAGLTSTSKIPVETVRLQDIPRLLPFPAPFHLRENANHLITQLVLNAVKPIRRVQLKTYCLNNEDELLDSLLRQGEDATFFDLPEYVTQSLVRKHMRPQLLKVIEGSHPRITVTVKTRAA